MAYKANYPFKNPLCGMLALAIGILALSSGCGNHTSLIDGHIKLPRRGREPASFKLYEQTLLSIADDDQGYSVCLEPVANKSTEQAEFAAHEISSPSSPISDLLNPDPATKRQVTIRKGKSGHLRTAKTRFWIHVDDIVIQMRGSRGSEEPTCNNHRGARQRAGGGLCCFTCDSVTICSNSSNSVAYDCGACGINGE